MITWNILFNRKIENLDNFTFCSDHAIWPHYSMANRRKKGGSGDRFPLLGSKITANGDCGHEIRRWLLLGRKTMSNLDSVLKRWDTTLLTKVWIVKAMVFLVVMYSCESCTVKKIEHWRTDVFKVWCWRRFWESFGQQGDQTSQS